MFSDLIQKIGSGQALSAVEQQELYLEARRIEQAEKLLNSLAKPGTRILVLDGVDVTDANIINARIVHAEAGDVTLDDLGIRVAYDSVYGITFGDSGGGDRIRILSSSGDQLQLQNEVGQIDLVIHLSDTLTPFVQWREDPVQAGRSDLVIGKGTMGARFEMVGNLGSSIDFRTEGDSGGSTFLRMTETTTTPPNPSASANAYHIYMKDDKLIIQYNDSGTVRYKYLDLTGVGATWQHTTSAP